ncbi:MAG: hypothetical protein WC023_06530 [Rhodocyclaceae bacterium]
MNTMSPSDIEVLLHCYYSPEPHERLEAPAVRDAIDRFLAAGLIAPNADAERTWRVTKRGEAHVRQLCALPLPEPAWVDAHGEVIRDPWLGGAP